MKKFFKALFVLFFSAMFIFLAWRIFTVNYYPAEVREIVDLSSSQSELFTQKDINNGGSMKGFFFTHSSAFDKNVNEMQVTLRWNTGVLTFPQLNPDGKFYFKLSTGLYGGEPRKEPAEVINKYEPVYQSGLYSFALYRYIRLGFTGIDMTGANALYIDIYNEGESEKVDTIIIYYSLLENFAARS